MVRSFHEAGASTLLVTDDLMAPCLVAGDPRAGVRARPPPGEFDTAAPGIVSVSRRWPPRSRLRVRGRRGRRLDLAEQLWKQFGTY